MIRAFIEILAAFAGTLAFSTVFNTPRTQLLVCGTVGGLVWSGYLLVCHLSGGSALAGVFTGAIIATCCARVLAFRRKMPATLFLVPGLICLVPGAGIYRAMYGIIENNLGFAADQGIHAMKAAGLIAIAVAIVMAMPGALFGGRKSAKGVQKS